MENTNLIESQTKTEQLLNKHEVWCSSFQLMFQVDHKVDILRDTIDELLDVLRENKNIDAENEKIDAENEQINANNAKIKAENETKKEDEEFKLITERNVIEKKYGMTHDDMVKLRLKELRGNIALMQTRNDNEQMIKLLMRKLDCLNEEMKLVNSCVEYYEVKETMEEMIEKKAKFQELFLISLKSP